MSDTPNTPTAAAAPEAAAVVFRPFTREDWYGFAGAERFADGAEPIIAEGKATMGDQRGWLLILDATGGCIMVDDDAQNDFGGRCLQHPFASPAEAEAWFRQEIGSPAHLLDFLLAGFAPV
jgi:hypothetical protein